MPVKPLFQLLQEKRLSAHCVYLHLIKNTEFFLKSMGLLAASCEPVPAMTGKEVYKITCTKQAL